MIRAVLMLGALLLAALIGIGAAFGSSLLVLHTIGLFP